MGRPIAWSDPTVEDLEATYVLCLEAFKSVFGFSDAEVYCDNSNALIDVMDEAPGARRHSKFKGRRKHLKGMGRSSRFHPNRLLRTH